MNDPRIDVERRGLLLAYLTIGWNSLEGVIAVGDGIIAGSIALLGFGVVSVIEGSSDAIILWRLASGSVAKAISRCVLCDTVSKSETRTNRLYDIFFLLLSLKSFKDIVNTFFRRQYRNVDNRKRQRLINIGNQLVDPFLRRRILSSCIVLDQS